MHGLQAYLKLVENGRPLDAPVTPHDPAAALGRLLAFAHGGEELRVAAPWLLAPEVCRRLEEEHGGSPPGSWAGLAGLAAGCGALEAGVDAFHPRIGPELDDPAGLRRRLVEAFTCRLIPPGSAAGLFVLLGLHPMWGLHVASSCDPDRRRLPAPSALLPEASLKIAQTATFGAIAAIIASLRALQPQRAYPIDALPPVVAAACQTARAMAEELQAATPPGSLPVFDAEIADTAGAHRRVWDMTMLDLVDAVLVPAGVMRRFDTGTFVVDPTALAQVRVGELDPAAQAGWLAWMTAPQPGSLVA